ncbi:MAG: ATP-binding cassette domain-containing protein [Elusimicrobiales bacterium]|nr:ATP-binding cassette domain-containing protein [Elusimicrobiales bacterium]
MIKTENLERRYGPTVAVAGVSFEINAGEVAGFLGPNGAGKTTTMRMLAGVLSPSSGRAEIHGLNVEERSLECRRLVGYLPESNPLYEEMEVTAFLKWNGAMRGLAGAELEAAVSAAVGKCGLAQAAGKDIGELSKGYRQRVGIANAILHNPPVLLLDEPTSGLDPNQAQEVRALIGELRKEKTIMLSTHILPEAQSVCDRIMIIAGGKIAADAKTADLMACAQGGHKFVLTLANADDSAVRQALLALPGAACCEYEEKAGEAVFTVSSENDLRAAIFRTAAGNNWPVLGLERRTASLEDIFRRLTQ